MPISPTNHPGNDDTFLRANLLQEQILQEPLKRNVMAPFPPPTPGIEAGPNEALLGKEEEVRSKVRLSGRPQPRPQHS